MLCPCNYYHKGKVQQRSKVQDHRRGMQTGLAQELHEMSGVPLGGGIPEVKKLQAVLPEYQLNVVSKEHLNALIYSGPEAEKHLYLCHHNDHYNIITSMPSLLARKQYCHKCKNGFYTLIWIW